MAGDEEVHGDKEVHDTILKAMRGELSDRELAMIGFAKDTKAAIIRTIEASPALEEAILHIADLCYRDGMITGH
jgi:hypothetical protein